MTATGDGAPLPASHHGYEKGRCREGATLALCATSWRITAAGLSHVRAFEDLTNAFQCPTYEAMATASEELVRPKDFNIVVQLFLHASVEVSGGDGRKKLIVPRSGGLMGNPSIVKIFSHCYKRVVSYWQRDWWKSDDMAKECIVTEPLTETRVDLSLAVYADDTQKLILADTSDANTLKTKIELNGEIFGHHLELASMARNKTKLVIMPTLTGLGSREQERLFFEDRLNLDGQCCHYTKSLGSMLHIRGSNMHERRARLQGMRNA